MTLAELITALEAADPNRVVPHGFTNPHSYRGYYHELAFEPAANVTVSDMLEDARLALGSTYQGWKGGDFTMSEHTECWLSMEGCASGDTISALLLQLMLAEPPLADAEALPATTSPMSQPEPLTEQQLTPDREQKIRRNYADCDSDFTVNVLLAEIDRLRAEGAGRDAQVMRRCAEFVRDTYGGEWADDAAATLERDADVTEHGCPGYEDAGWGDTVAERQLANCKHCGRPRAVCLAASEATTAPLAASQPSEAPGEGETAARASTGRLGDSGGEVVERDAIHNHFGLTYANYLVIPRTLLQSMDDEWQTGFVAHLDRLNEAFAHVPQAKGYKVEAATEHEVADLDEQQLAQLGITEDWYRGETPPKGLSPEALAEWEAAHEDPEGPTYYLDGEELDPHQRVLIPCEDPVPHYNRGRTRIQPQPGLPDTWISPATGATFDLHADYPVSRAQYDALLKGEDHGYQGLAWRHFRDFADGIPVLIAVRVVDEESIEGSIKLADYEAAAAGGDR